MAMTAVAIVHSLDVSLKTLKQERLFDVVIYRETRVEHPSIVIISRRADTLSMTIPLVSYSIYMFICSRLDYGFPIRIAILY